MAKREKIEKAEVDQVSDENEPELEDVAISDEDLDKDDNEAKKAKKQAKKNRAKQLSPEERKKLGKKRLLISLGVAILVLAVLFIIPVTRFGLLNLFGFRSSLVVTVLEDETKKPIPGATIEVGGRSDITDDFGRAQIDNLKLGKLTVKASKNGYSTDDLNVTNSLGKTNADPISLKIIGINLVVDINDWLSGKSIQNATVASSDSSEKTDNTGRANLVISPTNESEVELIVSADGYNQKKVKTKIGLVSRIISLIPNQKDYFISTRDGKPDIYSSDLDGSNQQKIIEATGSEDLRTVQLDVASDNRNAVLVSPREGKVVNGQTVAGVYRVYLENSKLEKISEGTGVLLLGWFDNRMIYSMRDPALNYDDPNLTQIYSYDLKTGANDRIVTSQHFQISKVVGDKLVYGTLVDYSVGSITSYSLRDQSSKTLASGIEYYYSSHISNNELQILMANNTSQIFNSVSDSLLTTTKPMGEDSNFAYSDDGKRVAWSEVRDGQGTLLVREIDTSKDTTVLRLAGLGSPMRWVGQDTVIATVQNSQESAHYAVSVSTGKYAKIVDVANNQPY